MICLLPEDIHEQCSCGPLHRLDLHFDLGGHGRIGSLQGVEAENGRDNLVRDGLTRSDEGAKAI